MNSEVMRRQNTKKLRTLNSRDRSGKHVSIAEAGDEDEDPKSGKKGLQMSKTPKEGNLSNMNLMQQNMSVDEKHSDKYYKPVECHYLVSVLKHKSVQVKEVKNESFEAIYEKARKTLKYHMKKLLLKRQFYLIDN